MSMWHRDRGRDLGDRARGFMDRAGGAMRRGMERVWGEDEPGYRSAGHDRWGRSPEYGRWGRGDEPGYRRPGYFRDRDPGYRGGGGREESGWGSVHYDRDFGYGAFGAVRDRGFEDRPYDLHGVDRSRDDQHMSGYDRDFGPRYDRDMRGYSRQDMDLGDRPRGWGRGWNRGRWEGRPRGWDYRGGD